MPILPAQIEMLANVEFKNDFANLELIDEEDAPCKATFNRGQIEKVILEDAYGKTTVVFKPQKPDDAAQLKELEYMLKRHVATLQENFGKIDVRPINHEVLYIKWPRMKKENNPVLIKKGDKVELWTPEDLEKRLKDFKFKEMVLNVNSYLRKANNNTIQAGIYFTLASIELPSEKKVNKKF